MPIQYDRLCVLQFRLFCFVWTRLMVRSADWTVHYHWLYFFFHIVMWLYMYISCTWFYVIIWGSCNLKRSRRTVIFLPVYKISSLKITPPKTPNSGQFSYPLPNIVKISLKGIVLFTLPKFGSVNGRSMNRYYGTSKFSTIWLPNRK
jgi:hypothetical protein